ncbi:MAG: NYN domain-containing protein, partial [Bacteroidota bacterium]
IGDLEECGAVRLERRRGMPYDYTVLIVNDEHPAVLEVRAEYAERGGTAGAAAPTLEATGSLDDDE